MTEGLESVDDGKTSIVDLSANETGNQWVDPVDSWDSVVLVTVKVEDVILLWKDGVNRDNPLVNKLDISSGKPDLSGDWVYELSIGLLSDDTFWGKLNISEDLLETALSVNIVDIQMFVDPVQEGLGIDLVAVVYLIASVNLVADEGDNNVIPVPEQVLNSVVGGGDGGSLLILEQDDQWVDILVEEDGVDEILLEGGHLPEPLEVDGSNVPLEHWVLPILTEEGKSVVHTEEGMSHNLVQFINGQIHNFITEVLGYLNVTSVDKTPLQRMSQQPSSQQDVVSDNGTFVFEQGVGVPVQFQKVQGRLAGHGGDQESGNDDELHVEK